MKTSCQKLAVNLIALGFGAALFSGCGTTSGYKQADKTGAGTSAFRDEIVNGKKAVDATMQSLSGIAVSATTDPRKAFEQYRKNVADLESIAEKVRSRATSIEEKGQACFKQWEQDLVTVQNPLLRALAEQRKARLQETFESIRAYSEPLKTQFAPWLSNLKDLQTYLGNDLTIAGVEAAKSLFTKTTNDGLEGQKSMDAMRWWPS